MVYHVIYSALFADIMHQHHAVLVAANERDLHREKGHLAPSMYQRLKLDADKLYQLVEGTRDVMRLPDPVGRVLTKTLLDDGLILEKVAVPLGVIGIIFESRPDVIPQILALILKSGNAVVLKGGREAIESNAAFMQIVSELNAACPWLPTGWAQLLDGREAVHEMLQYPQYVDLVIPRGSNDLVQSIMANTRIPVLGHADGVCHLYVHASADMDSAVRIAIDAKAQYPAACNALETLLVDQVLAPTFLPRFVQAAQAHGINLKGDPQVSLYVSDIAIDPVTDWHCEYGDLTLAMGVVPHLEAAITHINTYGSHHTDGILAQDADAIQRFFHAVDSAGVFANASTRFADGFRYGFGAEIGISTARTHARGPVGLEGLVTYKYLLTGSGHIVTDYVGDHASAFQHKPMQP
jgi:glutamate-5-semialdehyde dehydrogenase